MIARVLFSILAIIVALVGCTTVGVLPMKGAGPPKPKDCPLDIYVAERDISRPFEVVCLINAQTGTAVHHDRTGPGAVRAAMPDACLCGADAILVVDSGIDGDGVMIPRTGRATVKAIRYK